MPITRSSDLAIKMAKHAGGTGCFSTPEHGSKTWDFQHRWSALLPHMKAYRRGLQDYEYGWLLKQAGRQNVADDANKRVIPLALTEALPENINPRAGGDFSES